VPSILAWIVAVECHRPPAPGRRSMLDFKAPVSQRALDWAEWLRDQADVQLLMNVSAVGGSEQARRLDALRPQLLNAAMAHQAGTAALRDALRRIARNPPADLLLLLWMGHGVMNNRQRFLLHEDAEDADNLHSWELDSLLQRLRSASAPALQIGVFDTCAQVVSERPGNEQLGGGGKAAVRGQHFYFAASAAAIASLNPFEPTLASLALRSLQALDWPPQPAALDALLQHKMAALPSRPVRFEWTQGSGDQWSTREAAGDVNAEIARQARRCELSEPLFRHLWHEVSALLAQPGELAKAVRNGKVAALVRKLALTHPDAAEPDLLLDAWQRVQQVMQWAAPAAALGLSLPHWTALAQQLADRDARRAPEFSELRELLLWALDMGRNAGRDSARAHAALLRLLWLAQQQVQGSTPAALLLLALQADTMLGPLLPDLQAGAALPQGPVLLFVELELPANSKEPVVRRHWLLRHDIIEPGAEMALQGPMGEQLNTLVNEVQRGETRPLRVELLAPFLLLCGQREWLSYSIDLGLLTGVVAAAGEALERVALDSLWPIYWRWKDRLQGKELKLMPALWQQRATQVQQRALASAQLQCGFDDEQPGDEPHVRGLIYQPPSPAQMQRNIRKFYDAMIKGDPYMLWPAAEGADLPAFKAAVRQWLTGQRLPQLPEASRQARELGQLPELVLFVDEPERNPYAQAQRLTTVLPAAG
jgi:hypothetical protein